MGAARRLLPRRHRQRTPPLIGSANLAEFFVTVAISVTFLFHLNSPNMAASSWVW